jgi:hypothetical protein
MGCPDKGMVEGEMIKENGSLALVVFVGGDTGRVRFVHLLVTAQVADNGKVSPTAFYITRKCY